MTPTAPHLDALLQAVLADPFDPFPRLVLADRLEEQGDRLATGWRLLGEEDQWPQLRHLWSWPDGRCDKEVFWQCLSEEITGTPEPRRGCWVLPDVVFDRLPWGDGYSYFRGSYFCSYDSPGEALVAAALAFTEAGWRPREPRVRRVLCGGM